MSNLSLHSSFSVAAVAVGVGGEAAFEAVGVLAAAQGIDALRLQQSELDQGVAILVTDLERRGHPRLGIESDAVDAMVDFAPDAGRGVLVLLQHRVHAALLLR